MSSLAPHHQQLSLLFPRIASLKDSSPFILISHSIQQSSWYLLHEIIHRLPNDANKILLRFEHLESSNFNHVIQCSDKSLNWIITELKTRLKNDEKNVLFIDSWNHIPVDSLRETLLSLIMPNLTIIGCYNTSISNEAHSKISYYPSPLALLSFFATSKILVLPDRSSDTLREIENKQIEALNLLMPLGSNKSKFIIELEHRRRSGRSLQASYRIDYSLHKIEYLKDEPNTESNEAQNGIILEGLTTFNLTTTEKQKRAKDEVELPFLQAQNLNDSASGGAIVYEFEKDDDYDEEDPYEDPF